MPIYARETKNKGRVYDVVVRDSATGKKVWRRGFARKGPANQPGTAAYEELRLRNEIRKGEVIPSEKLTTGAYLYGAFLPSLGHGRPSTLATYRAAVVRFVGTPEQPLPLHRTPLARLSGDLLQGWVREHSHLAPKTLRLYMSVMHRALADAVARGTLAKNPATGVRVVAGEERLPPIMSLDEVREFIAAVENGPHGPLIIAALITGKRWSELTGLRWQDVDFDRRSFRVRRAKRAASVMAMPLASSVVAELHRQALRVQELREAAGEYWLDEGWVFPAPRGGHLVHATFLSAWHRLVDQRWPGLHFHDLRHQAATLMAWAGVHPKVAQQMLGHDDIRQTMDIYTHVEAGELEAAAGAIEGLLQR